MRSGSVGHHASREASQRPCMPGPQQRHGTSEPEPRPARALGRRGPDTDRPRRGQPQAPCFPGAPSGGGGDGRGAGEKPQHGKRKSHPNECSSGFLPCAGLTPFPAVPHRPRDHMIARRSRCVNPQTAGGRRRRPRARPAGRARRPRRGAERGTSGAGGARSRTAPRSPNDARRRRRQGQPPGRPQTARDGERREASPPPTRHAPAREGSPGGAATGESRHLAATPGPTGGRDARSGAGAARRAAAAARAQQRPGGREPRGHRSRGPEQRGQTARATRDCRAYRCVRQHSGPGGGLAPPGARPTRQPSRLAAERWRQPPRSIGALRAAVRAWRASASSCEPRAAWRASRSVAQRRGALASVSEPLRASRSVASIAERRRQPSRSVPWAAAVLYTRY